MTWRTALPIALLPLAALLALGLGHARRGVEAPRSPSEAAATARPPPLEAGRGVDPTSTPPEGTRRAEGEADGPEDRPVAPSPSFRLETIDVLTGRPVPSTWNLGTGEVVAGPWPAGASPTPAEEAAQAEGVRRSIAAWEAGFLATGATRPEALASCDDFFWGGARPLTVRPPAGYVTMPFAGWVRQTVAAGVREAYAVLPLFREAILDLEVVGPDGSPAVGAGLELLEVAGLWLNPAVEDMGAGRLRVRGIPFLPGDVVSGHIGQARSAEAMEPRLVELDAISAPPSFEARIPPRLDDPWRLVVRLTGSGEGTFADHLDTDQDLPIEARVERPRGSSRLRARVLDRDGSPLPGARLGGVATDSDGIAVLTELSEGELVLEATANGHFPARTTAFVRAEFENEVTLREPMGTRLDVLVTEATGQPRIGATVTVVGALVFDVVDGVQRLDGTTDGHGRRCFARVEPRPEGAEVRANWGGRHASARVRLVDGEPTAVHLVLD